MLFVLALVQTLKESIAMYKATTQWQSNRYTKLFVKDGILYFFVYVSHFPLFFCFCPSPSYSPTRPTLEYPRKTNHSIFSSSRNMFHNIVNIFLNGLAINSASMLVLGMVSSIAICVMMPRFIISVRELYDRDSHGGWRGIDTGFGVLSQPIASEHTTVSEIVFAAGQDEIVDGRADDSETIELGVVGDTTCRV